MPFSAFLIDGDDWSRADIGLLAAAAGVLTLIFAAITIIVGFYAVDQLRQRERTSLSCDELGKSHSLKR